MSGAAEGKPLPGRVALLQASVKGHLVRKRFQHLKEEYENIVKEIEGSLDLLRWNTGLIPRPMFPPTSVQKPARVKEFSAVEAGPSKDHLQEKQEVRSCQPELLSEHRSEMQCPSQLPIEASDPVSESAVGGWRLSEESEEGQDCSSMSSVWSSAVLERESPGLSQDLRFQRGKVMPRTVSGLQCYRQHLTMELLWLQQAIASRKHYLILKQRLGNPE